MLGLMLRSTLRSIVRFEVRPVHAAIAFAVSFPFFVAAVVTLASCTNGATPVCGPDAGCGPGVDGEMLDGQESDASDSSAPTDAPSDVAKDARGDVPVDTTPDVPGDSPVDATKG
jgi:hypothetical protein